MNVRDFLKTNKLLQIVLGLGAAVMALLMLLYCYQGWFTRYMADDYCNANMFATDAVGGLVDRYLTGFGGNRYSNIWLVGISEFLGGIKSIPYLPMFHIVLWIIGLVWVMTELKKLLKVDWSFVMTAFFALSTAYFTLIQLPNLYQTVYWRSSMTTHFAPVVYGTLLIAYLLRQANKPIEQKFTFGTYLIAFISAFLVGGFSEPADATQVTMLVLAIAAIWYWSKSPTRARMIKLLGWTLFAALLSLLVMAVSPANSRRLGNDPHSIFQILRDSAIYGYVFMYKTFTELPLPTLISILMPAALMGLYSKIELSQTQKRNVWMLMVAALALAYLLTVAGFSPSALGQGYPVERMRIYARWMMTLALMLDGALLGILFASRLSHPVLQWVLIGLLFATAVVYPARSIVTAYHELPAYRARAAAWDERNDIIYQLKAQGKTKLVIQQFDGVYSTKELDTLPTHWVNKCAAKYYNVKSISAIPFK